jgi:hypothetical protein
MVDLRAERWKAVERESEKARKRESEKADGRLDK